MFRARLLHPHSRRKLPIVCKVDKRAISSANDIDSHRSWVGTQESARNSHFRSFRNRRDSPGKSMMHEVEMKQLLIEVDDFQLANVPKLGQIMAQLDQGAETEMDAAVSDFRRLFLDPLDAAMRKERIAKKQEQNPLDF